MTLVRSLAGVLLAACAATVVATTVAAPAGYAGTDGQPPTTPQGLTITSITSSSVTLSWQPSTDNTGVSGYDILRAQGRQSHRLLTTVTGTSFTDTGLTPSVSYSYEVRARDAAGNLSTLTPAVTAVTHRAGTTVPGGAPCLVEYYQSVASGTVTATVVLTNTGPATVPTWRLAWTFPGDTSIGAGGWNATLTQQGHAATATAMSFDGTIPPANDVEFGFTGTAVSSAAAPAAFTMNGAACATG